MFYRHVLKTKLLLLKIMTIIIYQIKPGENREYFYSQLDRLFPYLKDKYIQTYGMQYQINSPNNAILMKLFHQICEDNGIVHDNKIIFEYLSKFEEKSKGIQLKLFDDIL